jgi:hypothetical protein
VKGLVSGGPALSGEIKSLCLRFTSETTQTHDCQCLQELSVGYDGLMLGGAKSYELKTWSSCFIPQPTSSTG